MDLGVLKFVGIKSFSDYEEKQFLGNITATLPEFLSRQEEDSSNGWRSSESISDWYRSLWLLEKKGNF